MSGFGCCGTQRWRQFDSERSIVRAVDDEEMDEPVAFAIFGVAVLDLADQMIFRQHSAALKERHGQFLGEAPVIEF